MLSIIVDTINYNGNIFMRREYKTPYADRFPRHAAREQMQVIARDFGLERETLKAANEREIAMRVACAHYAVSRVLNGSYEEPRETRVYATDGSRTSIIATWDKDDENRVCNMVSLGGSRVDLYIDNEVHHLVVKTPRDAANALIAARVNHAWRMDCTWSEEYRGVSGFSTLRP